MTTTYMEWKETTCRYEALIGGRTFCVDDESFAQVFDEATQDPRNDEHKVYGHFLNVNVWEGQLGQNAHVYYAEQARAYQHRIYIDHDRGQELLLRDTQLGSWEGITIQSFHWFEGYLPVRSDRPTSCFILTLVSTFPLPTELVEQIEAPSYVIHTRFDLPRLEV